MLRRAVLLGHRFGPHTATSSPHASASLLPSLRCASSSSAASSQPERLLDESIMEHIVCPISKYPLRYDAARGLIICPEIRVAYPIRDGVPLLVPSEGRVLREGEDA